MQTENVTSENRMHEDKQTHIMVMRVTNLKMTVTIAMAATRVLLVLMLMLIHFNGRKEEIPHRGMYAMPPSTTCGSKINKIILRLKTTTGVSM